MLAQDDIPYYSQSFEQHQEGTNRNNLAYYHGEPEGSEPHPFHGSGTFFVGCDGFDVAFDDQPGLQPSRPGGG